MQLKKTLLFLALSGAATFSSCKKDDESVVKEVTEQEVVDNYANIVYANYEDAYSLAQELQKKVDAFVASPSEANLDAAKNAWLAARKPYGLSEAYRFYGGPIDDEDGPEGQLNAWPLDEAYIDYVDGNSTSGIINDLSKTIDATTIKGLNEKDGEANISTGYHAVEFLLWGQDLSDGAGAGTRPYTDYVTGSGSTSSNQGRRGDYLKLVTSIIVEDLKSVLDEWATSGDYRKNFEADPSKSIEGLLSAAAKLSKGELAGERIVVAYENEEKEDEHSCFSDNTHNDILYNAQGIKNVYFGYYTKTNGTKIEGAGLDDLIRQKDATFSTKLDAIVNASVVAAGSIKAPFDQEFLSANPAGRTRIKTTYTSLQDQGDLFVEAASKLGYTVSASID